MNVGSSDGRTVAKHTVIRRMLGQQAGAFPHVRHRLGVHGLLIVDATAGHGYQPDGVSVDLDSTPYLVLRQVDFLRSRRVPVLGYAFERDGQTFQRLRGNLAERSDCDEEKYEHADGCGGLHLRHGDATEHVPDIEEDHRGAWAVVYLDDPNHSGASTLTGDVVDWICEGPSTVFAAIGANANGAARRPGHHDESFARYDELLRETYRSQGFFRREPVLCVLAGDSHRWAYLIVGSKKFADDVERTFGISMDDVMTSQGGRSRRLRGEIHRGFPAVHAALARLHNQVNHD